MPAVKKDPTTRARPNKASTAASLTAQAKSKVPALPPRVISEYVGEEYVEHEGEWNPQTLAWWADLWASPMAGEYHSSDRHALFILAVLIDSFWRSPSKDLASEIRLQRQTFGLTPYDRRRLEWTLPPEEEPKPKGRARRSSAGVAQGRKKADPRLTLVS